MIFFGPSRHAHEPDLKIGLVLEHPDFVALFSLNDLWRLVLKLRRQSSFKGVLWLEQVIVDGNQRVVDFAGIGVGQERVGDRTLDAEFYDLDLFEILRGSR